MSQLQIVVLGLLSPFILLFLLSFTGLHRWWPVIEREDYDTRGRAKFGLFLFLQKGIAYPETTVNHEREHLWQMWRVTPLVHGALVQRNKKYRLWAESRAFAVSVKFGRPIEDCATSLSQNYGLGISYNQAMAAIRKALNRL